MTVQTVPPSQASVAERTECFLKIHEYMMVIVDDIGVLSKQWDGIHLAHLRMKRVRVPLSYPAPDDFYGGGSGGLLG